MDRRTNIFFKKIVIICAFQVILIPAFDPCDNHDVIENQEKRSDNYTLDSENDFAYSDDGLTEGWYRVISRSGTEMPTTAPDPFQCGTLYPIWLDGILPSVEDGQVTRKVCLRSFVSTCDNSWDIQIKNCTNGYYVYNLTSSDRTNSAYCFGDGGVQCPDGESSTNGFYPGCTSIGFPNASVTPVVYSTLKLASPSLTSSLYVVFECKFNEIAGANYAHDIYWYINDHYVIDHKNVFYSDIRDTDLVPEDWVGKHHMNMIVRCSVRLRTTNGSPPGNFHNSDWFKAGLYPDKYQYQVLEGQTTTITFTAKVPVGCFNAREQKHCDHHLYVTQPKYQSTPTKCLQSNNILQQDVAFDGYQKCGLTVPSLSYDKPILFNVTGYIDGMYNVDRQRSTKIRLTSLKSVVDLTGVWDNITIPDIEILISDAQQEMKDRICVAYNDPHLHTADGTDYNYHGIGEYIMYKNKRLPYAVHALFSKCRSASCNCGIAIRSGKSLMVVRTCAGISRRYIRGLSSPYIEKRICDSKSMIIKEEGNTFTVTLPIGTEVKFSVSTQTVNFISIKPSVLDLESAEGLCGYISKENGNKDDDFVPRYSTTPITDSQEFAKSWSVTGTSDSLFDENPQVLSSTVFLHTYCTCGKTATPTEGLTGLLDCSLTQPMQACNEYASEFSFSSKCSTGVRKKRSIADSIGGHKIVRRSIEDSDDVVDFIPLLIDDDVFDDSIVPEVPEWRNGWTFEKAEETCKKEFEVGFSPEVSEASGVNSTDYLQSCIDDIQISGDTSYLEVTLSTMKSVAKTELLLNETLVLETASNGTVTLLEKLTSQLCKNNCSGYGICNNGSCECDVLHGEEDCSQLKSAPPRNISIPDDGLCQTRERACQKTNIYGHFTSTDVWCKISHFEVLENTKSYTSIDVIVMATYINAFHVTCPFATARRKRAADPLTVLADGYEISLSNDGVNFGDNVTIIAYDEECYNCDPVTINCTLLETCPELLTTTVSTEQETTDFFQTTTARTTDEDKLVFSTLEMAMTSTVENNIMTTISETSTDKSAITTALTATSEAPSEMSESFTTTSTTYESSVSGENDDSNIGVIAGGIVASIVILIVLVLASYKVYKVKCRKDGHIQANVINSVMVPNDSKSKSVNDYNYMINNLMVPDGPQKESFNQKSLFDNLKRRQSSMTFAFELSEEERRTPDQLFCVERSDTFSIN